MKILLTNDDGIQAPGLKALASAVAKKWDVTIVAPADQKSATSHSVTLGQKLRVIKNSGGKVSQYAVHGTPVDCVKIAISEIENFYPDLIISGINQGANTGVSVYYSGTISAAREGLINRIPAMAVSLCDKQYQNFSVAREIAGKLIEAYHRRAIPRDIFLNVNVPPVPKAEILGVKVTKQADSHFIEEFILEKKRGRSRIYSLVGEIEIYDPDGTSDEEAVQANYISVTPLKIDETDYSAMAPLEKWFAKKKV